MTIRIAPIVGIFSIAGAAVILTGCDDWDDFGRLVEGKPTKAQVAHEQSVSLHLSSSPPVVEQEVEDEPFERCTVVPAHLFRTHQCDEETGQIVPIR